MDPCCAHASSEHPQQRALPCPALSIPRSHRTSPEGRNPHSKIPPRGFGFSSCGKPGPSLYRGTKMGTES